MDQPIPMGPTVKCPLCGSSNPESKKYCGDCGAVLGPFAQSVSAYLDANLGPRLQALLKEELRDRSVAEIEIAQAAVARVSEWAKLLGLFVGIPLAILAIVLGILGISTYADFNSKVSTLRNEVEQKLTKASSEGDNLLTEYGKLRTELQQNRALANEVQDLTDKVQKLESKFIRILPSADLTPDLEQKVRSSFREVVAHFGKLGFRHEGGAVDVQVWREDMNAYYEPAENRILIFPTFAHDRQTVYHAYSAYALITVNKVATQGLSFGLMDYFTCSFSNNPRLGEVAVRETRKLYPSYSVDKPYLRNLENRRKFQNQSTRVGRVVEVWETWGGAFWEIRQLIGQEAGDKLLFASWGSMAPTNDLAAQEVAFVKTLLQRSRSIDGGKWTPEIRLIFERRGLKL